MARWKAILRKVPKSQVFRVQRKKRAPFALRYLPHAAFATALLGVLFGSFRNQFGELFATYQPLARKPSLMITGGTAPPVNPPAGLRVVGPADDLSDGSPKVIGLGGNSAGTPLGPKVIELNASSAGAPAGPAVIAVSPNAPAATDSAKLPTVVKLGPNPSRAPAGVIASMQVVDGDTIDVSGQRYRLIGIDTPESGVQAKCQAERELAARATRRLREIVAGGDVKFMRVACACPPGTEGTDTCNHGRFCGVLTAGGRDVGGILIGEGLARSYLCGATQCPARVKWC